ncbi:MAG: type I glyceraldehyde-3-phosphate dehydrogenase, partial [Fusobacterium sp.]|nr:type I glyceraldehyde-3-phosphate dehydrogenase [Fusobacterium sp.]
MKVAINGFGRIGKIAFQIAIEKGLDVVAVNDPFLAPDYIEYLLKYDTVHGKFNGELSHDENNIIVNGKKIRVFNELEPKNVPWGELGVHTVIECSGVFVEVEKAQAFLDAGAKKVVISAPSKTAPMFVMGVN